MLPKTENFEELYYVEWQPHMAGVLSKPNIDRIKKVEAVVESTKPKRLFKFGKGAEDSAF